eukprot:10424067-Alexandrium_andersonii.AAC.1
MGSPKVRLRARTRGLHALHPYLAMPLFVVGLQVLLSRCAGVLRREVGVAPHTCSASSCLRAACPLGPLRMD